MTTKSKARGTTAERDVVRYLQRWWPAAERRALSGNKDRGDVAGVPGVVIEVKAARTQQLAAWQRETTQEQINAGARTCLLVVKRPYKPVGQWDAYLPGDVLPVGILDHLPEEVMGGWVRMDFALAVAILRTLGH